MPKRNYISSLLITFALMLVAPVAASTPTGQSFGRWQVTSITSLSGVDGNDASAGILQSYDRDEFSINWLQPFNVVISARINDCQGEDEDFQASYAISVERWLKAGSAIEKRIANDFSSWKQQAQFMCNDRSKVDRFELAQIKSAVRNFTDRLKYLSGSN